MSRSTVIARSAPDRASVRGVSQAASISKTLKELRARHALSQEDVARLLGSSWATVSRWERQTAMPTPDAASRIGRLAQLSKRIGDAIPPESLVAFLSTPNSLLRGYAPIDMLGSGYSFEDLLAFVDSALSGDMA
jgi:DNA-binding transcriptional regulator YiaG